MLRAVLISPLRAPRVATKYSRELNPCLKLERIGSSIERLCASCITPIFAEAHLRFEISPRAPELIIIAIELSASLTRDAKNPLMFSSRSDQVLTTNL